MGLISIGAYNNPCRMNILGIVLLELYLFLPNIASSVPWFGHVAIMLITVIFAIFANRKVDTSFFALCLYLALTFVNAYINKGDMNGTIIKAFTLITAYFVLINYRLIPYREKKLIVFIAIACNLFTQICTIYYALIDPSIVRNIMFGELNGYGIANFTNVYSYIVYTFILIWMTKASENKMKIFYAAMLIINVIALFLANFLTSYIILFVGFIFYYIICQSKKGIRIVAISFVFTILLLVFYNFAAICNTLVDKLYLSVDVQVRLKELSNFVTLGQYTERSDLFSRFEAYSTSIITFLRNPLTGGLFIKGNGIGGHSGILDIVGTYGLCSITYFIFMKRMVQASFNNLSLKNHKYCLLQWIIYFIIGIVNPVDEYYYFFLIGLIFPAICDTKKQEM